MQRVGSTGNTSTVARPRKERRVTYVVRSSDEATHCSGINALQIGSSYFGSSGIPGEGDKLFTGSRDGTIKRWDLQSAQPSCAATFESHVDWVNDMVLVGDDILVSGSSDTSIKAWSAFSSGDCLRTLRQHGDYVTSLASARDTKVIASGGLGGEVYVWDLEAATPLARPAGDGNAESSSGSNGGSYGTIGAAGPGRPTGSIGSATTAASDRNHSGSNSLLLPDGSVSDGSYSPIPAKGHKESVYALAMNSTGTVLVSGGTEKALRVWDPRTGKKQWKLKGHTDNVRALLLDPSGRLCLSGSSDSIIRLWDVGQQRCIHSYAVHTDSVWALAGDPASNTIYSGGRDGCIYATDLVSRESVLLAVEKQPVLRLALQGKDSIWAATTSSALRRWSTVDSDQGRLLRTSSTFKAGSGLARVRSSIDDTALPEPLNKEPEQAIEGSAGIVRHTVLNDRRRVLTTDSDGVVKLWEITRGAVIEDYGKVSFEEKEKELFEKVSVSPWFTMDTRLGSIAIHLDTPQCFSAEMYALDCNVEGASEDTKINLGQHTLRGLFEHWLARNRSSGTATPNGDIPNGRLPEAPVDNETANNSNGDDVRGDEPWLDGVLPAFQFSRPCPPSIITEGTHGGLWRRKATDLLGTEGPREIPHWCIDATLHNKLPARDSPKCSFFLLPHEGSSLPQLPQGKLTAPRILRIQKVMNYVVDRLELAPLDEEESVSIINGGNGNAMFKPCPLNTQTVEILCNNEVLSPDVSLATVRAYVWKKPEDLSLFYRTAQPR